MNRNWSVKFHMNNLNLWNIISLGKKYLKSHGMETVFNLGQFFLNAPAFIFHLLEMLREPDNFELFLMNSNHFLETNTHLVCTVFNGRCSKIDISNSTG